ncbi:hypothetical protein CDAR_424061 [Caerostris darwini]|uniref:Secreted protein n=1 Tax=Caerostris darwini TaxID=1538125 RepID=A0AAV4T1Z8_9ARAC|nr:hypothetical protein CDAR_424061 [Caerostris darwini]
MLLHFGICSLSYLFPFSSTGVAVRFPDRWRLCTPNIDRQNRCLLSPSQANVPVGRQLQTLNCNCYPSPPPTLNDFFTNSRKSKRFSRVLRVVRLFCIGQS